MEITRGYINQIDGRHVIICQDYKRFSSNNEKNELWVLFRESNHQELYLWYFNFQLTLLLTWNSFNPSMDK